MKRVLRNILTVLALACFSTAAWALEKDGDVYIRTITNTGDRFGGEVAQLYIDGELRGFRKVYLEPGESMTVAITPEPLDDASYPDGYTVPEEPPKYPITLDSRVTDLQQTFWGRILYRFVMSTVSKPEKEAKKLPDGPEKDKVLKGAAFMKKGVENISLRSMSMSAGRIFPYNYAQAFAAIANGHLIKGIGYFLKKIKVPKLPKEES